FYSRSLGLGLDLDYVLSKFFCVLLHLASKLVSIMVAIVWTEVHMDHDFTKSMKELENSYTILEELRFIIVERKDNCYGSTYSKTTITKTKVSIEDSKKAKDFRVLKNLEDEATESEVIKDEGSRVKAEHESTKDMVRCEKMFEVDEAIDSENSRAISFQVKGNDGDNWPRIRDLFSIRHKANYLSTP
nr:hypothetical protein [Tanacetum cinerariifolium]